MSRAYFEPLIGTVNGFNQDFTTRLPYEPGSVLPVIVLPLGQGEWAETGGNGVHLKVAPLPDDQPHAWYRPL